MSHGPTHYPGHGFCIYCGARGSLSDEHIMPLALGGVHVLDNASCDQCCKITSAFEQDVARGLWGDFRYAYTRARRRKKERPTELDLPSIAGVSIHVPYSEYPAPLVCYKMERPGSLVDAPPVVDQSMYWELIALTSDGRAEEFEQRHQSPLTARFKHVPTSFGRMILKVAYGQVLTVCDPRDFRPICLPYILGHERNVSYLVGSTADTPPPDDDVGYRMATLLWTKRDKVLIGAEIRFYANAPTPVYLAVVGEVLRADVDGVAAKLGELTKLL